MEIVFFISLAAVVYAYAGYFVAAGVLAFFFHAAHAVDEEYTPDISIIIAAYNEEACIAQKIENTLNLLYPAHALEIIVASDASGDRTDEISRSYAHRGVRLVRAPRRGGKTAAQNYAVAQARGSILVFSDATTMYEPAALRKLVRHFKDGRIGCVGGEEHFIASDTGLAAEAGFFWKYETLLRRFESSFHTAIGVSGCMFAVRKELYGGLDETTIEDFALPLLVYEKGFRTIYEKEAIGYEHAAKDTRRELMRKARIVAGGLQVVVRLRRMLNPFTYPVLAWQLISHKIFRWCAPFFLLCALGSNLVVCSKNMVYLSIMGIQIIFYSLACVGFLVTRAGGTLPKSMRLIYHFCAINAAAFLGLWQFLKTKRTVMWETIR